MSSRAAMTRARTGRGGRADLAVPGARVVGRRVGGDAEEAEAVHRALADLGRVLADAAGEHDRVEPVHRGGHRRDGRAQPVQVRLPGELGAGVAVRPRGPGSRACRRSRPARTGRTGAPGPPPARPGGMCTCSSSHSTSPGSTDPDLVAITRPSSGVKPIVVSTDLPSADRGQGRARAEVAGDEPQVGGVAPEEFRRPAARRRRATARGIRNAAGSSASATPPAARRWRRRRGWWRGRRYRSTPRRAPSGSTACTASRAASDFGWCSGARSVSDSSRCRTCSSIRTGPV